MRALLEQGLSGAAIARELGISKSTVSYHKRRLGHSIDVRCNRRYDWDAVQRFYDAGHSITESRPVPTEHRLPSTSLLVVKRTAHI